MNRGSSTLLLAFVLAGLATTAALWLREPPPPPLAPPSPPPSSPVAPPPPGPGPEQTAPAPQGPSNELPANAPRVWIAMDTLGTYQAPRPLRVVVHRGEHVLQAQVEAIAGADGERGGRALLRIEADGRMLHRVVQLPGGGEAVVDVGFPTTLRGTVYDAEGHTVRGARVWVGGAPDDEIESGDTGAFSADVAGGVGVPIVVRAAGYAWTSRIVDAVPGGGPLEFALAPACDLTVRLNGSEAAARGAIVAVLPSGTSFSTELLQYPFFAQGLLAQWPLDAQGRAVVPGLPRGAVVGVQIAGPQLPTTPPVAVDLRRATAAADVAARPKAAAVVRGVVVDERGEPLAGAQVVCRVHGSEPSRSANSLLLPVACAHDGASWAITGDDGAFELAPPAAKGCELAISAAGRACLVRPLSGEPGGMRCPLPPWPDEPSQLRVRAPEPAVIWGVRVEPPDREFTAVAADHAFARALPAPVLATFRVRCSRSGGEWSEPRVAAEVAVIGDWELPAVLLER
jgi:hypothetical protein